MNFVHVTAILSLFWGDFFSREMRTNRAEVHRRTSPKKNTRVSREGLELAKRGREKKFNSKRYLEKRL